MKEFYPQNLLSYISGGYWNEWSISIRVLISIAIQILIFPKFAKIEITKFQFSIKYE